MITLNFVLEWSGAFLGLIGAALMALRGRRARYGWLFFLGANVAYISLALRIGVMGLLVQQSGFIVISLFGTYKSKALSKISWLRKHTSTRALRSQNARLEA